MRRDLNVLFVGIDAYSRMGGIQRFNQRVIRVLGSLMGSTVQSCNVLTVRDTTDDPACDVEGVKLFGSRGSKPRTAWHFIKRLIADRPDVILFGHTLVTPLAWIAMLLAPRARRLLFVHGVEVWDDAAFRKVSFAERFSVRRAIHRIISVSRFTAERMRDSFDLGDRPIDLLPNAVDVPTIAPKPAPTAGFDKALASVAPKRILTVARLDEWGKGVGVVIDALPQVIDRIGDVEYLIVGDGVLRKEMEQKAVDRGVARFVRFAGRVSDAALNDAFQSSQVFAMPSQKEGFGIAYLEAWQHSLPVIAGNRDAGPEVVDDGANGLIVESTSSTAVADAIVKLLKDPELAQRLGAAGHQKMLRQYTHERFQERLTRLLQGSTPGDAGPIVPVRGEKLHILVSAFACQPGKGSEPGVGWNMVRELSRWHRVWVITRGENRKAIQAELAKKPNPNLHFIYHDLPVWIPWWRRGLRGVQVHYYLWQLTARKVALRAHQRIGFDVVQHATYVKYWAPSLAGLIGVPFVWGPVGGGEKAPAPFVKEMSFRGRLSERLRLLAQRISELDPFVRLTARRATLARATTPDTALRLRAIGADAVQVYPEAAMPDDELDQFNAIEPVETGPTRFISMGRLLHWKGFHLGIRAFVAAELKDAEYWILGDGPERQWLEQLAAELGASDRVKFLNRLPRNETLEHLAQATALVHPSLHDSGGWVCLEAMAIGRPVLCLDLGGPAVQVTDETGIKVPAHTPQQTVRDLAAAMKRVAGDAQLRRQMGIAGRQRVREMFSWDARGRDLVKLYERLVGRCDISIIETPVPQSILAAPTPIRRQVTR